MAFELLLMLLKLYEFIQWTGFVKKNYITMSIEGWIFVKSYFFPVNPYYYVLLFLMILICKLLKLPIQYMHMYITQPYADYAKVWSNIS